MYSIPKMRVVLIAALVLLVVGATGVWSQEEEETIVRKQVISTNPILDMFVWYNLEWEISVSPNSTIGAFGGYIKLEDEEDEFTTTDNYYSGTIFYRYYPTASFKGFYLGARFGYYHVEEETADQKSEGDFMGMGIDVGYGWLLGKPQRVAIGIGIGAVRIFGGDLEDVQATLPTIRFINVGIAF
jgi:hypothetical protein